MRSKVGLRIGWLIALVVGAPAQAAEYISVDLHPNAATINRVGVRFKAILHDHGMRRVSQGIKECYDHSFASPERLAECILWDVSASRMDGIMRKLFIARGTPDPGPATPFMGPRAFDARMQTYGRLAFGPDEASIGRYLGDAPNQVLKRVVP